MTKRVKVIIGMLAVICLAASAYAGTPITLYQSFAGNLNYTGIGGTLRTQSNSGNACAVTSSSSELLSDIPSGASVKAAYLYWAGSYSTQAGSTQTTPDYDITFNGNDLSADRMFTEIFNYYGEEYDFFSGFKDVTAIVTSNGTYTFSNLDVNTGDPHCIRQAVVAGWALVVIYEDPAEVLRVVNIFDGFQYHWGSSVSVTPDNFVIPGPPDLKDGKMSHISWEGDVENSAPSGGFTEQLLFNGNALTDGFNPSNNQFNSTINTLGTDTSYGVDFDTYDVSDYLSAGDTSATSTFSTGGDLVLLSAEVISVTNTPVANLSVTKTHTGDFTVGQDAAYTIEVINNGPSDETDTVTVTDTLPAGLTYVSSLEPGWDPVSVVGQTISWTYTGSAVSAGSAFPTITLTVNPDASAMPEVTNTVTVSSPTFDHIPENDIANDPTTVVGPDLSTSTLTVSDLNGGDAEPGDVLRYTLTLIESGGGDTSGVTVTDNMPADITDFTVVALPPGSTDNSSATGGTNGTGYLDVIDISVTGNGSELIIFEVTVAAGTPAGTMIDNSADIDNPSGIGGIVNAPTVIVSESLVPASGNKSLYLYSSPNMLNRTPPSSSQAEVVINGAGNSETWTMTPVSQADILIDGSTGSIPVVLWLDESGRGSTRDFTIELRTGAGTIGSLSQTITFTTTPQEYSFDIPVSGDVLLGVGDALELNIQNNSARANRRLVVTPETGSGNSRVNLYANTVINVDAVEFYDSAYPGGSRIDMIKQEETLYVRSVISDPFGSFDISDAILDIVDSDGLPVISGEPMTNVEDSGAATSTWELGVDIAASDPTGVWTARVTAIEGTEGLVTHSIQNTFRVVSSITSVAFIDAYGNPVNGYPMDGGTGTAYIRVVDESANLDTGAVDTVVVTVSHPDTGDSETLTLSETGQNTGVFESAGLPLSTTGGMGLNDGTLYVTGGFNIEATYDGESDTAYIPTLAIISAFRSMVEDGQVVVEWETASEIGTIGFNLLREDKGRFVRLNDRLLPGLLVSRQGGSYRFVDETATPGMPYTYKLVENDMRGRTCVYGPYTVTSENPASAASIDTSRHMTRLSGKYRTFGAGSKAYVRSARKPAALKTMRVNARKLAKQAVRRVLFPWQRDRIKIRVVQSGVYYVGVSSIEEAFGISARMAERLIRRHRLSLSSRGEPVPWKPADDNSDLMFYGTAVDSIYTSENVYWLTIGRGLTMASEHIDASANDPGDETYACDIHTEENHYALTALFDDPTCDYWLWDYLVAGAAGLDSKVFTVTSNGAVPTSGFASLSVNLKGANNDVACDMDHHVEIRVNGMKVGEGFFDGTSAATIEVPVEQLLLEDGENAVELTGRADTGAAFSVFYVDSFDLNYRRAYAADGNSLTFTGDENETVTVTGFTTPDIHLFDVSDAANPVALTGINPEGADGAYRISFRPAGDDTTYLAVASDGFKAPASVDGASRSWLKQRWNGADYIVIAPDELRDAADRLCEYRGGQGLETMVVGLPDIMNEFNHGIAGPDAVRAFLTHAHNHWRKAPTYVVLAGDGTYDYKNFGGHGDNLMPPLMVSTPDGLFASDSTLADVVGNDGVPEMAVGRIPVLTAGEMRLYIDKIKAYERTAGVASGPIMMLADDPDDGGLFSADSDAVASLLPAHVATQKIYLESLSLDHARNMIIEGFNNGPALVNYLGHGAVDRFAGDSSGEAMLASIDVPLLEGSGHFPLVAAMTCVAGGFSLPGFDCLSETLVVAEDGGAVAVWSPTGLSLNADARVLDEELFLALFQEQERVLGDAIVNACRAYAESGCESNLPAIYSLLGDPALRVRR